MGMGKDLVVINLTKPLLWAPEMASCLSQKEEMLRQSMDTSTACDP